MATANEAWDKAFGNADLQLSEIVLSGKLNN
jgi:hypothetical protein